MRLSLFSGGDEDYFEYRGEKSAADRTEIREGDFRIKGGVCVRYIGGRKVEMATAELFAYRNRECLVKSDKL